MSNIGISLLIGGIISLIALIIIVILAILKRRYKTVSLEKVELREQKFIYVFFKKWLWVFIIFALGLCALCCWVLFFNELSK